MSAKFPGGGEQGLFWPAVYSKVSIVNRNLGIIFRTLTYLSQEKFLNLSKSMVRQHLEYASVIWSPFYKKDKIMLENTQRRATRLIPH